LGKSVLTNQRAGAKKGRPGRHEMVKAKRAASGMLTPENVATALGIGRNQTYEALQQGKIPAIRFGRRWLIAKVTIDQILAGELTPIAV
jgi:excisionase family DNA binding protein